MSPYDLVVKLLVQLVVILAACRLAGRIGRALGQAQVIGEMVAGVLLGPSLLGLLAPEVQSWLFPAGPVVGDGGRAGTHPSMTILYAVAQLGLVLYMFVVGMEFDLRLVADRKRSAGSVALAGMIVPLLLGAAAALALRGRAELFPDEVAPATAALYLGAAMCVTAFPVMARILTEKGIARTRMGTLALAAGASNDAIAWCLLAAVIATLDGSWTTAGWAAGGGAAFAFAMLTGGRRALRALDRRVRREGRLGSSVMGTALLCLLASAIVTDAVGIHAVFGAFVCGAAMPRGPVAEALTARIEPLTTTLLLPVFFAYSGLNTHVDLLDTGVLWLLCGVLTAVAIAGKGAGCLLAARLAGEPWRDAAAIGVLMNARGLMELIILGIGLEQGVITPTLFTMLVAMAIVTTLMASPLFELVRGRGAGRGFSR